MKKSRDNRAAAALGYVAAMVDRLAGYLDVPLRYPLLLLGSRSAVLEHPPSCARGRYQTYRPPLPPATLIHLRVWLRLCCLL